MPFCVIILYRGEVMNKKIINKFGKHYLLGEGKDGQLYWLEEPTWDCGWYWGGLYLHTYTNNRQPTRSKDLNSHEHFDTKFLVGSYNDYKEFFKDSVLVGDDIWTIMELTNTFYILKKAAGLFEKGSSWIAKNNCYDIIKDQKLYEEIVKVKIPAVISEICNLLGGETKPEQFKKMVKIED